MSGCIPYRRRPPPVRNMRTVLKKASYGTRRIFRSPPCSKQASVVQKGYSVPETPFYGTEQAMYREWPSGVPTEAEERGSGSEIGDFAKNGHLYAPVTAAKQSQSAMDYLRLPPTPLNHRRLPPSYSQTTAEPPGPLPGSRKLRRGVSVNRRSNSIIIFARTEP